ncbi:MAG: hypothetical protein AB1894_19075 [Chloroflexota bacterium]
MKLKIPSYRIFPSRIAFDTPVWGTVRILALLFTIFVLMVLSSLFYSQSGMPEFAFLYWIFPIGVRYLILILIVTGWVIMNGARYIQAVYDLETAGRSLFYLLALFTGFGYPRLTVRDGEKQLSSDQENLLDKIGGPGYLFMQPGNVVVIENLSGTPRVVGPGRQFLSRQEVIKTTLSLAERSATVEKMVAITKDGIPVEARDVRYRYRLLRKADTQVSASPVNDSLYNFSEEAVLKMAYNRTILSTGEPVWHDGVNRVIDTVITDYLAENFIDGLTAPITQGRDPRSEIYAQLRSEGVRGRLNGLGAELLWIDIGQFYISEKLVEETRVSSWQTRWEAEANRDRADGESQRLAYQEYGRAEAQAEMVKNVVDVVDAIRVQRDPNDDLQGVYRTVLTGIARLLETMRQQNQG